MRTEGTNSDQALNALAEVRRELARLGERVAALEATAARTVAVPGPVKPTEISEELLLVLSAAVAAFLGKKAPIRQIHLVRTAAWSQQGRVSIQASHVLPAHHARDRKSVV